MRKITIARPTIADITIDVKNNFNLFVPKN